MVGLGHILGDFFWYQFTQADVENSEIGRASEVRYLVNISNDHPLFNLLLVCRSILRYLLECLPQAYFLGGEGRN